MEKIRDENGFWLTEDGNVFKEPWVDSEFIQIKVTPKELNFLNQLILDALPTNVVGKEHMPTGYVRLLEKCLKALDKEYINRDSYYKSVGSVSISKPYCNTYHGPSKLKGC